MLAPDAKADETRREFAAGRESGRTAARAAAPSAHRRAGLTSRRPMNRSCAIFCAAWMIRVGNSRRSCTLLSSGSTFSPRASGAGEDVGGRDRVLDREVDADPADRRHGVGGIADREQAGPLPAGQPVERDRSADGVVISSAALERRSSSGAARGDFLAERLDAPAPDSLRPRPSGSGRRTANNRRGRSSRAGARARHCRAGLAGRLRLLGSRNQKHVHRRAEILRAEARLSRSDRGCGRRRQWSSRARSSSPSVEPNAGDPARLLDEPVDRAPPSRRLKAGKGRRLVAQEIEEVPLRHHRDERRRRAKVRQIADRAIRARRRAQLRAVALRCAAA